MINLLPPSQINELNEERNLKIVLNLGILFLALLFSFYLVLLAVKINLSAKISAQDYLLKEEGKRIDREKEKEIQEINQDILLAEKFYQKKVDFFPRLLEISQILPPEISLKNLVLNLEKDGLSVSLSGFAPSREVFLRSIAILKEKFQEVSFSPESLLKEANLEFSIKFKIK
jgi:hypothetical protein